MKKIKLFEDFNKENFTSDILNNVSDPNKPIVRDEYVGKPYVYVVQGENLLPNNEIVYALEFIKIDTFSAYYNATNYLENLGYVCGSMERLSPIGFSHDSYDVSKWRNMNNEEKTTLDGVIIPKNNFREGGALVLFYKEPKY